MLASSITNFKSMPGGAETHTTKEITEMLRYLVQNVPTRDEVKEMLHTTVNQAKQEMMDYTDKRIGLAEGKFIQSVRKEDEKIDAVIDAAEEYNAIPAESAKELKKLGPFPKLAAT